METFDDRLKAEFTDMQTRTAKLSAFILDNPQFLTLSEHHQHLLQRQHEAMAQYVDVLELRLKDLGAA